MSDVPDKPTNTTRPWADLTPEEQRVWSGGAVFGGTASERAERELIRASIKAKRDARWHLEKLAPDMAEALEGVVAAWCNESPANPAKVFNRDEWFAVLDVAEKLRAIGASDAE